MLLITQPYMIIVTVGVWISMILYDFLTLKLNIEKYEDEMQFAEKILIAQNYNNTVLLNQYAKEKKVRYLPKREKISKLLSGTPLQNTFFLVNAIFGTKRNTIYFVDRKHICCLPIDAAEYAAAIRQYSCVKGKYSISFCVEVA